MEIRTRPVKLLSTRCMVAAMVRKAKANMKVKAVAEAKEQDPFWRVVKKPLLFSRYITHE
jgi:hypothetical protein